MNELAVVYQPLVDLVPYARNARKHSATQITKLKASLREFGWANPMLVAERGMIAGHARLAAAMELMREGLPIPFIDDPTQGPTIDLSHLTAAQRRAYVLADNRLAEEAVWDLDLLRLEFDELRTADFDLGLAGFGLGEVDTILNGWKPDFSKHEATDAEMDPLLVLLRLRCLRSDLPAVQATLKEALAKFDRVTIDVA